MSPKRILLAAACAAAFATAGTARAASCKVNGATAVSFARYDTFSAARQQLRSTLSYDCAPPASPSLTLSAGSSGNASARYMTRAGSADRLLYNVYTDAACTSVWSDQPSQAIPGVGDHNQTLSFYTCVPPLQDVSAGSYADTLIVTINF
ncbi:Csu type fimbrial protein [Anaeromyxobacter paludicola]|uniref:Spore coat protein U/FanG domain-containing protein n=1 Tax=Anaeromyxobacter paludicola TaxID=2918171 RepID=A0ABM7X6V4_9BACT|nr:spore coat U domain-containing protein [Anaeromyxobacter paludicola]BDG07545.1 hypothetical protein AMPC_06580 [Anaeromyxobacter paludicola]